MAFFFAYHFCSFSFVILGASSRGVPARWELWTSLCWARCRRSDPSSPAPRRRKPQTADRPRLRRCRAAGGRPLRTRRRPPRRDPGAGAPSPCAGRSPRRSCSAAAPSGTVCYASVSVALEKLYSTCVSSLLFDLLWRKRGRLRLSGVTCYDLIIKLPQSLLPFLFGVKLGFGKDDENLLSGGGIK